MNNSRRLLFQTCRIALYAVAVALFLLIPTAFFEAYPLCLIYLSTGFRCPTCGMTRAFSCVFHGRLLDAWGYNPLVALFFPLFCAVLLSDLVSWIARLRGKEKGNLFEWCLRKIFPPMPR